MKRNIIRLNEAQLKRLVAESVKGVLKEYDLNQWGQGKEDLFLQAIERMADYVLENIGTDYFENAIDLNECDGDDIQELLSCIDNIDTDIFDKPYKIKTLTSKYISKCYKPVIETLVEEEYQYVLDDELLDAVYDRYDTQSIVNKNAYGGGGYETLKKFSNAVKDQVADKLKEIYS